MEVTKGSSVTAQLCDLAQLERQCYKLHITVVQTTLTHLAPVTNTRCTYTKGGGATN